MLDYTLGDSAYKSWQSRQEKYEMMRAMEAEVQHLRAINARPEIIKAAVDRLNAFKRTF